MYFEWYLSDANGPFRPASEAVNKWSKTIQEKATELGAAPIDVSVGGGGGGGGGGASQVVDENKTQAAKQSEKILKRVKSEIGTAQQQRTDGQAADSQASAYKWETSGPTKENIEASQATSSLFQSIFGWLAVVWTWLVALLTAPMQRFRQWKNSGAGGGAFDGATGNAPQAAHEAEEKERVRTDNKMWAYLREQWDKQDKSKDVVTGGVAGSYLGKHAADIMTVVDDIGVLKRQTDLLQENVEIRTDGSVANDVSRSEAKAQAKKEAADPVHLRDKNLKEEDVYLINKTLEALKKMAADQKLLGFDEQLRRMFESISMYNEFVMEGAVDAATAERMSAAMKAMWASVLRFALDHGAKIEDLRAALDNYNIVKEQSAFTKGVKKVYTKVKEYVKKAVSVVKEVVETVKGWIGWLWGKIKQVVRKVVEVIMDIPIVREVVTFVEEKIVNPVYQAAKSFFETAKEALSSAVSRVAGVVRQAFNAVAETARVAVQRIGLLASKAWNWVTAKAGQLWDWLKDTAFWNTLVDGFNALASALSFVFVKFLQPVLSWCWQGLSLLWDYVLGPVLAFVAPALVQFCQFLYRYLRYLWQGAADISQNFIWGSDEFDIIDVTRVGGRISRWRMRMRAALRRVLETSWLQWWLDPSIRRGLDIDPREHVQQQQSRAHDDFQRRDHSQQQQTAMAFSVLAVVLTALVFVAVLLSGGALLPAGIALACATLSAILQRESMHLETNMSIGEERKKIIQNAIALTQHVIMVVTLVYQGFIAPTAATVAQTTAAAAASVARFIGEHLGTLSAWVKKITDALRIQQRTKSALAQIDKFLRSIGLGGAVVVAMNLHDSVAGMLNSVLETASGAFATASTVAGQLFSSLKSSLRRQQQEKDEQEQQQQQQQEKEEEEEEDENNKKKHQSTCHQGKTTRTGEVDGWTVTKVSQLLITRNTNFEFHGAPPAQYQLAKDGADPITISFKESNEHPGKMEAHFSRELSAEEQATFKLTEAATNGAPASTVQDALDALFKKSERDETVKWTSDVYLDEHINQVKQVETVVTDQGEASLTTFPSGKLSVTVKPRGSSDGAAKPKPMHLDLLPGTASNSANLVKAMRGEVTADHLRLLISSQLLDVDGDSLDEVIRNDLAKLEALSKANQAAHESARGNHRGAETGGARAQGSNRADQDNAQSEPGDSSSSSSSSFIRTIWGWSKDILASGWNMLASVWSTAKQTALSRISPLWTWLTQNPLAKKVWSWVAQTSFGQRLTEVATAIRTRVETWAQRALAFVTNLLPTSVARWLGLEPAVQAAQADTQGDPADPVTQENAATMMRFFDALVARKSGGAATDSVTQVSKDLREAFKRHGGGVGLDQAVEMLADRARGNSAQQMTDEEKKELHARIKQQGTAKGLFDWLYGIAAKKNSKAGAQQQHASALGTGASGSASASAAPQTKGAVLHEHMRTTNAFYSRRLMTFLDPPTFEAKSAALVMRQLSDHYGFPDGTGIQQNVATAQIQADVEKFVRNGDQQGLIEYVKEFLDRPIPEEIAEVPGMAEKWQAAKEDHKQMIGNGLKLLAERGWSQMTDALVAETTRDLVKLLAESVDNLWVEDRAEALIDQAAAADAPLLFEWSKQETAYRVIEEDGKYRMEVDKAALGDIHERHVQKILRRQGYEIIDAKLPGNTGMDILAVKRNAAGEVTKILIVECKATSQSSVNAPRLSDTKKGKQLTTTWIAEKIEKMHKQGGDLAAAAALLRANLHLVRPLIAFQKNGLNSWAHQDRVPEIFPAEIERILAENIPDWQMTD